VRGTSYCAQGAVSIFDIDGICADALRDTVRFVLRVMKKQGDGRISNSRASPP
jgi:hypothetical protein